MRTIITLFLVATFATSFAQEKLDRIIRKDGEAIECVVTEIGADEIKYNYPDRPALSFGIDKALVDRVEFATGEVIDVEKSTFDNMAYYANQNKRALKTGFLKPLNTNLEFTYEQLIRPGRAWESTIGVIGIGFDPDDRNPVGFYGKYAYKLIRTPDYYMHRMHYAHILKGTYIAPEISTRFVKYDKRNYYWPPQDEVERVEEFSVAFTLKIGKQWVFDNFLVIDIFAGLGYGFNNNNDNYDWVNYGYTIGTEDFPLAFTSGFRVGIVF